MRFHLHAAKGGRGHADNRERLLVNHQRAAEHLRIAAHPAVPEIVTEDRHRMRMRRLVVFVREHAAQCGLHAQYTEVFAGDEFLLHELHAVRGRGAEAHVARAGGGHQAAEQLAVTAQIFVERVRSDTVEAPAAGAVQHDQLFRMRDRQRAQHDCVEQAEDRGIGADSQCERDHRRCRETRIAPQSAQGVACVASRILKPRNAALIPIRFFGLRHAAEFPAGGGSRVLFAHTLGSEFRLHHRQMEVHLIVQFPVQPRAAKQLDDALPRSHKRSYSVNRTKRSISATVRAHSSDSCATCLRPERVIS